MPELPEVETTLRGIAPHIQTHQVTGVLVRQHQLRWPIPENLAGLLVGQRLLTLQRRAKYLLLQFEQGTLLIHLGMSGSLRVIDSSLPAQKHDHVDILFEHAKGIRLTDPRRFGAVLWLTEPIMAHALLAKLGPEPLTPAFSADYLYQQARTRRVVVKSFLMNQQIVTGIGNIYCTEALFAAGIDPRRLAKSLSWQQCDALVTHSKAILQAAITQGGTTLRDFVGGDGQPGYFQQTLFVYGRAGKACQRCQQILLEIRQANRSTVYCPNCQT